MRDKLRRRYQVQKEVSRSGFYEGTIALSQLERLRGLVHHGSSGQSDSEVRLRFEFLRNEFDSPMLSGQMAVDLDLECQRCLGAMSIPIRLDFRLMIDASDELVRSSSIDTLYSDDGFIDIYTVAEDEIMLAIPLVALHEDEACNEHWQQPDSDPDSALTDNPFAVLKQLKTTD